MDKSRLGCTRRFAFGSVVAAACRRFCRVAVCDSDSLRCEGNSAQHSAAQTQHPRPEQESGPAEAHQDRSELLPNPWCHSAWFAVAATRCTKARAGPRAPVFGGRRPLSECTTHDCLCQCHLLICQSLPSPYQYVAIATTSSVDSGVYIQLLFTIAYNRTD